MVQKRLGALVRTDWGGMLDGWGRGDGGWFRVIGLTEGVGGVEWVLPCLRWGGEEVVGFK